MKVRNLRIETVENKQRIRNLVCKISNGALQEKDQS